MYAPGVAAPKAWLVADRRVHTSLILWRNLT
jgi:hypothetical protein